MTDIGFMELTMIALVALLVMGPRQMLEFVTEAGRWYGRLQRRLAELRDTVSNELGNLPNPTARDAGDWLARKIEQDAGIDIDARLDIDKDIDKDDKTGSK